MAVNEEKIRLIFGLKLRQIREERTLSLFGLSKKTGLSKSYLNEIEKGKKYPKTDKILLLAEALGTSYDDLVSSKLTGKMAPLADIIQSGILKLIPLDLFGIEESNLIDIVANAPAQVSAFISALFEIAREYNINRESFFLAMLRSHQESHFNYFEEIEKETQVFIKKYGLNNSQKLLPEELEEILVEEFNYEVDKNSLTATGYMEQVRSVFLPGEKPRLLIAKNVSQSQLAFILAKELGYCHLQIKIRPNTFTWIKFETFDEVMNNFKASYFAGALTINRQLIKNDLKAFFGREEWDAPAFHAFMTGYTDSAETFFQRLTNILPTDFGLKDLFFLRIKHRVGTEDFELDKEFHLNKQHRPHSNHLKEKYCRRWVSLDLLRSPSAYYTQQGISVSAQVSEFPDSSVQYLILAASNQDPFNDSYRRSFCVGIELSKRTREKIHFLNDPRLSHKKVGVTCEHCGIESCEVRAAEPLQLHNKQKNRDIEQRIEEIRLEERGKGI